jgi:hypothetical protein
MIIESLIKREGGTEVIIGDDKYLFEPNEDGAHVSEVDNKEHIERFLSITEGFAEYSSVTQTEAVAKRPGRPSLAK